MRRFTTSTLFLASLLGAFLLLLLSLRILRWLRPASGDIITNEIRDMVADIQGSLEALPGIPGKFGVSFSTPAAGIGLGLCVLAGVVWALHVRRDRPQQRSRSKSS